MPPAPAPSAESALRHARRRDDPATLAFAGIIAQSLRARRRPLIRGLSENCFRHLLDAYFGGVELVNAKAAYEISDEASKFDAYDEFEEIVELLLAHRASPSEQNRWLAYAIASAAMGENHLWQDLGLPSRQVLSQLMQTYFPTLAARNSGDMKWKKFLYRQLCECAGIPICKSPHCADCCDYAACFGPEDAQ